MIIKQNLIAIGSLFILLPNQAMEIATQSDCKIQQAYTTASQEFSQTHRGCTLTFTRKGQTIGYVQYTINTYAQTVIIEKVYIEKKLRGQKLGGTMFKKALDDILALRYKDITLTADPFEVDINSQARPKARADLVKFYERFGFKVISNERQDPQDPQSPFVTSTMKYIPSPAKKE